MQGRGRRLRDGHVAAPPSASLSSKFASIISVALVAIAVGTCPSHDAFEAFLAAAAAHPSAWLGGISTFAEKLHIAVAAETKSYLVLRTGIFRGRRFVGAFNHWFRLPTLPTLPTTAASLRLPDSFAAAGRLLCDADGAMPHEQLAVLFVLGFVAQQLLPPRFMARHAHCSLSSLREGRLWTVLTANLAHANPAHLLHNLIQLLHLGPVVHSALGCEKAALLLLAAAVGASLASVFWHGVLGRRPGAGSVGGSGVAMALVAANAALFPNVRVSFYGLELSAHLVPVAYLLLDLASAQGQRGDVDISAHAGGAAAGWLLATRWQPWWLLS